MERSSGFDPEGEGSIPSPPANPTVVSMATQPTFNRTDAGSNPVGGTTFLKPRRYQELIQLSICIGVAMPATMLEAYEFLGWSDVLEKPYPGWREGVVDWLEENIMIYMGDFPDAP